MKRILGFSSVPLDERLGAGSERIANLYRFLPARYARTVVALTGIRSPKESRGPGGGVREIRVASPAQTLYFHLERMRLLPFFRVARAHELFAGVAKRQIEEGCDLVQFDTLWLTPWARHVPLGVPVVYGSHNFETDWYAGELRRYPFRRSHAAFLSGLERRAALRADRVLAVTREDADKFVASFGVPREKIAIVPNGFDDERFRPASAEEKREARRALRLPENARIALFSGSDVGPNRDALESILRMIAPKAEPGVFVVAAGSVGRRYAGAGSDRVLITGPVPDIVPYFRAADVGLNPIRYGSGSNIKVLQYLGSGLPVVSTDFGMRGFDDLRGQVTVARIDRFFYHMARAQADEAATGAVRSRYSWRSAAAALAAVYVDLLGGDSPLTRRSSNESRKG
ncbi:MAG: glycosyltransferase, partial [Candidatus Latescibacterota bacterium]